MSDDVEVRAAEALEEGGIEVTLPPQVSVRCKEKESRGLIAMYVA